MCAQMISFCYRDSKFWIVCIYFIVSNTLSLNAASDNQATFKGRGYITYINDIRVPLSTNRDEMSLQFKTEQKNAFLFYIGNHGHNSLTSYSVAVTLEEGLLFLRFTLSSPHLRENSVAYMRKMSCSSYYLTCADNTWHSLLVTRSNGDVRAQIDGVDFQSESMTQISFNTDNRNVFVGGLPRNVSIPKMSRVNPFLGCLQQVLYKYESEQINLIKLAKERARSNVFVTEGVILGQCADLFPLQPVTFLTPESFLKVRSWKAVSRGQLEFSFRTNEKNGLLLYQHSDRANNLGRYDFLALELRQSQLYFLINTGSGTFQSYVVPQGSDNKQSSSDGQWHKVLFIFQEGIMKVSLDNHQPLKRTQSSYQHLNLNGAMYLGGIPSNIKASLPYEVWSGVLGLSFVGCLKDLHIDHEPVNLALELESSPNKEGIQRGCSPLRSFNFCENQPCNSGTCTIGWNRFICDCTSTNFSGPTCNENAPIVQFNGFQRMKIKLQRGYQTEAEDIVLRFKTTQTTGLLFFAQNQDSVGSDKMELLIQNRRLALLINFGKGTQNFNTSMVVADDRWHTCKIKRRKKSLTILVDQTVSTFEITGKSKLISHGSLFVGQASLNDRVEYRDRASQTAQYFIGSMMHFTFNGVNYFEKAIAYSPPYIEVTASLGFNPVIYRHPVYFQTPNAYLLMPKVGIFGDFIIDFYLKTTRPDGLVLLLDGDSSDYLVIELVSGSLRVTFNWGSGLHGKPSFLKINDGEWHHVQLIRFNSRDKSLAFRVDGLPRGMDATLPVTSGGLNFNRLGNLYLGGVELGFINNNKFSSKMGFQGCIASFQMNKTSPEESLDGSGSVRIVNLYTSKLRSLNVSEDCPAPKFSCHADTCYYGGRCVQQWRRLRCDCAPTSFRGETCSEVSTTLRFGEKPGYVVMELTPVQNTIRDELTLGIQTTKKQNAALVHVFGMGNKPDYIQLHIVLDKGHAIVQAKYNMGSQAHSLYETNVDVSDGRYHIVRFKRDGPDATLQVDSRPEIKKQPGQSQSSHFNKQKTIFIGQSSITMSRRVKRYVDGNFEPFEGFISGLVFNSIPLIDIINGSKFQGVSVFNKSNVLIDGSFIPNLKGFPPKKKTLPGSSSDKWQSTPGSTKNTDKNADSQVGLISPRPDCYDSYRNSDCQPLPPDGIVKPNIRYTTPGYQGGNNPSDNRKNKYPDTITPKNDNSDDAVTPRWDPSVIVQTDNKNSNDFTFGFDPTKSINIWLIVAISCGGALVLLLLTCVIYRCRRKDEGSYSIDDSRNYAGSFDPASRPLREIPGNVCASGPMVMGNGTLKKNDKISKAKKNSRDSKSKRKEAKEWYV